MHTRREPAGDTDISGLQLKRAILMTIAENAGFSYQSWATLVLRKCAEQHSPDPTHRESLLKWAWSSIVHLPVEGYTYEQIHTIGMDYRQASKKTIIVPSVPNFDDYGHITNQHTWPMKFSQTNEYKVKWWVEENGQTGIAVWVPEVPFPLLRVHVDLGGRADFILGNPYPDRLAVNPQLVYESYPTTEQLDAVMRYLQALDKGYEYPEKLLAATRAHDETVRLFRKVRSGDRALLRSE